MTKRKKKTQNEGTAFEDIEKSIHIRPDPVDLQSKEKTFESKRNTKREPINGSAIVLDANQKVLSKAEFRNLSSDGVSLEIFPVPVKPHDLVHVHFTSALNLGTVACTVQWIVNIEGHRNQHKLLGLKFNSLTPVKQKKLDEFLKKLKEGRNTDPFWGG